MRKMPFTFLFSWLFCWVVAQPTSNAWELLEVSGLLFKNGNYEGSRNAAMEGLKFTKAKKDLLLNAELTLQLARAIEATGQIRQADSLAGNVLQRLHKKRKKHADAYASALSDKGFYLIELGNYPLADSLLSLAKSVQQQAIGQNHPRYASTIGRMGLSKVERKHYPAAEPLYLEAIKILEYQPEKNLEYGVSLERLAELYIETERYEAAEPLLIAALDIAGTHPFCAVLLNHLGRIEQGKGNERADSLFEKSLEIQLKAGTSKHPHYIKTLTTLSDYYSNTGNNEKAILLLTDARNRCISSLGNDHLNLATILTNLGELKRLEGDTMDVGEYFLKAAAIFRANGNFPDYNRARHNLAVFYKDDRQSFNQAISIFEEIVKDVADKNISNQYFQAFLLKNLSETLVYTGDPSNLDRAESCLKMGAAIFSNAYSKNHPNYLDFLPALSEVTELQGKSEIACNYYVESCKLLSELLTRYYSALSEEQRLSFLDNYLNYHTILINSFANRFMDKFPGLNRSVGELRMASKGASLQLEVNNRLLALASKDPILSQLYALHTTARGKLINLLLNPPNSVTRYKPVVDSLENEVNRLEKEMSRRSSDIAKLMEIQSHTELTYENLRKTLLPDEAVIDFLHFKPFDPHTQLQDVRKYFALISSRQLDYPVLVPLADSSEVADLIKKDPSKPDSYVRRKPISFQLYQKIWAPLEPYLAGIRRVYVCPEGALHRVAFHALYANSQCDTLLSEKYDIRYRLSPGDLLQTPLPPVEEKSIVLMGGAFYDSAATGGIEDIALRSEEEDTTGRGTKFNYLKGTEKEVRNIGEQFKKSGWKTAVLTGPDASEQNFRKISETSSPGIVHIATHGFFFNQTNPPEHHGGTLAERLKASPKPFLRSGIVLSGANIAWKSTGDLQPETDGVLPAIEIAGLDFSNTGLVVLSACETGRGDVYSQEGVFGLQRAFRQAGVRSLIVSLWKVPDKETEELMAAFYQYCLQGETYAAALRKAQSGMAKTRDPFYWAAFVLIE